MTVGLLAITSCIDNPGTFTMSIDSGSRMEVLDAEGNVTFTLDIGQPACADDQDNDLDGHVDSGSDPECDSPADANERLDGLQTATASSVPLEIDAAGVVTVDATALEVQQREVCPVTIEGVPWCLGVTVVGVGTPQTGSIDASGLSVPWNVQLEIEAVTGFADLGTSCVIGPISTVLEGDIYDTVTGEAPIEAAGATLPAAAGCGPWTDGINAFLGLPATGTASLDTTILDADGNPVSVS